VAVAGFFNEHTLHTHSSPEGPLTGFIPAAFQSNEATGFGGSAPGLGASQIVHLSIAVAGFFNEHTLHTHSLPEGPLTGFIPAALQSNEAVGFGGSAPGLGASQIAHFSVALEGFFNIQVLHVHWSLVLAMGAFVSAALRSKPPFVA